MLFLGNSVRTLRSYAVMMLILLFFGHASWLVICLGLSRERLGKERSIKMIETIYEEEYTLVHY